MSLYAVTGNEDVSLCCVTGNEDVSQCCVTRNEDVSLCCVTGNEDVSLCCVIGNEDVSLCCVIGNEDVSLCCVTGNEDLSIDHVVDSFALVLKKILWETLHFFDGMLCGKCCNSCSWSLSPFTRLDTYCGRHGRQQLWARKGCMCVTSQH